MSTCLKGAFTLVVFLVLVRSSGAQTAMFPMGSEGRLESLVASGVDPSTVKRACGKYFSLVTDVVKVGAVTFVSDLVDKNGVKRRVMPMIGLNKLQIRVIDGLKIPTIKVLQPNDSIYPWVEVSISLEDLKQASCLDHAEIIKY